MSPSENALSAARSHLVRQLVFFDEQYPQFCDSYLYGLPDADRNAVERTIRQYHEALGGMIEKEDGELAELLKSIVLIGSRVDVAYPDDGDVETYTVVYPTDSDPDMNRISFLSPFGRQLLCAAPNRPMEVEIPNGSLKLVIRDIRYAYIGGFTRES